MLKQARRARSRARVLVPGGPGQIGSVESINGPVPGLPGVLNLLGTGLSVDPQSGEVVGTSFSLGIGPSLCGCSTTKSIGPSFGLPEKVDFVGPLVKAAEFLTDFFTAPLAPPGAGGFDLQPSAASGGFLLYPSRPNTNSIRTSYAK